MIVMLDLGPQAPSSKDQHWDVGLHLPPWITSTEKAQIESRLDSWTERLLQVRPSMCCPASVMGMLCFHQNCSFIRSATTKAAAKYLEA